MYGSEYSLWDMLYRNHTSSSVIEPGITAIKKEQHSLCNHIKAFCPPKARNTDAKEQPNRVRETKPHSNTKEQLQKPLVPFYQKRNRMIKENHKLNINQ